MPRRKHPVLGKPPAEPQGCSSAETLLSCSCRDLPSFSQPCPRKWNCSERLRQRTPGSAEKQFMARPATGEY